MAITSYINSFTEKSTIISHLKKSSCHTFLYLFFSTKLKIIFIDLNRPGNLAAFVRVEVSVTFLRHTADKKQNKKKLCYLKSQLFLIAYRRKSKTPLSWNQGFWFSGKWLCPQHPLFSSWVVLQMTQNVTVCLCTEGPFPLCLDNSFSPLNCYSPVRPADGLTSLPHLHSSLQDKKIASSIPFTGLWCLSYLLTNSLSFPRL